jgi:rsbT co-antagonist protein RsbR
MRARASKRYAPGGSAGSWIWRWCVVRHAVSIGDSRTWYSSREVAAKLSAAGIRVETDLRNEKINYKVREHSLAKVPYLLVLGKREAEERAVLQERIIQAQAATLAELSTPLIPINDQVMVMPLIGAIDTGRARQMLDAVLHGIENSRVEVVIVDITGVTVVDTQVAATLIHAAQAVRLLGAQMVLTGIRPEVAQTLVGLGVKLTDIVTHSTLQSGIAFAMQRTNR